MSLLQLTLAVPQALEEELLEQLLAHPEWASGFTLYRAEGHSTRLESLTPQEQVRGRTVRATVQIVLEEDHARALVAHLKQCFPKPDVAWWLTPVLEFGRLA